MLTYTNPTGIHTFLQLSVEADCNGLIGSEVIRLGIQAERKTLTETSCICTKPYKKTLPVIH